ncbi:MAG TPA: alpha/beta hydrolase [Moraxellaceae bacterium]|nr:alpha/beta hydrolase [Moraxellaceae bacterium]
MIPMLPLRRTFVRTLDQVTALIPRPVLRAPVNDDGASLSPLLHWLIYLRKLSAQETNPGAIDVTEARRRFRRDILPLRAGYPVHAVHDLTVQGAAGELKARHYIPDDSGALPALLVYFHGGGFVLGDLDTHDDVCRLLCIESGMQVLSVDYRLAPEHPFPAPVQDAVAALRWAQANADRFGVRPGAIAVGGDSAGGNLAAVAAQQMAAEGHPLLAQLLIYPGTDRTVRRPSHDRFGKGFFLTDEDREWFYSLYLAGDNGLGQDHRVSPLLAHPLPPVAPAVVVTAGFDMLRDEGEAYADHLCAQGVEVELVRVNNLGHGFMNLTGVHQDSELAAIRLARCFRLLCNRELSLRLQPRRKRA